MLNGQQEASWAELQLEGGETRGRYGISRSQKPGLEPRWGLLGGTGTGKGGPVGGAGPLCPQTPAPSSLVLLCVAETDFCRPHFPGSRPASCSLADGRSWGKMGGLRKGEARVFSSVSSHLGLRLHQQPSLLHSSGAHRTFLSVSSFAELPQALDCCHITPSLGPSSLEMAMTFRCCEFFSCCLFGELFIFKWQPNSKIGIFSKIHSKIS